MKTIIISFLMIFSFLICRTQTLEPYVIASAGKQVSNNGISLSYTIGEPVVATFRSSDNSKILTQGFQQPNDIIISGIDNSNLNFNVTFFPNPTRDIVNIRIFNSIPDRKFSIIFLDRIGQILEIPISKKTINKIENIKIDLTDFDEGIYLVLIIDEVLKIKYADFKITKLL